MRLQEERKRKKEEEEIKKKSERSQKMAEFDKWKTPPKANFVISKKLAAASGEGVSRCVYLLLCYYYFYFNELEFLFYGE